MIRDLYITDSKKHGRGIFTKKNFKKGDTVFIIKGKIKHWMVTNQKESLYGPNWVGIGKNLWIDPEEPAVYLNHSCDPSCGIKGRVTVKALRNIMIGEEITVDYATTEIDRLWHMKCDCGSKNCRKVINSIQFLPKKIYNKYTPFIPTYFKKVYETKNAVK